MLELWSLRRAESPTEESGHLGNTMKFSKFITATIQNIFFKYSPRF